VERGLAQVPAEAIEGVDNDRVAPAGIGQQRGEAVTLDGGTGLPVREDPLIRDTDGGEGV
jgi:hypothetical protein